MKKALTCALIALMGFLILPTVYADTVTITWTPDLIDDHSYDLTTGLYEADNAFATTTKMTITRPDFEISIEAGWSPETVAFSYVFFWDRYGIFIGYGSGTGTQTGGSKYLGALDYHFIPPIAAKSYAVSVACGADQILVDGHTWSGVYENPVYNYVMPSTDLLTDVMETPSYLNYVTDYSGATLDEIFTPTITSIYNAAYDYGALMDEVDDYAAAGITTIQLLQVVSNGQFNSTYSPPWKITSGDTGAWSDGYVRIQLHTSEASGLYYEPTPAAPAVNHYVSVDFYAEGEGSDAYRFFGGVTALTIPADTWTRVSAIGVPVGIYRIYLYRSVNQYFRVDNVQIFNIDGLSYTKAQIDTALSYYGYLPYNVELYLPDTLDASFANAEYMIRGSQYGVSTEVVHYKDYFESEFGNDYTDGIAESAGSMWAVFDLWRSIYGDRATTYWETVQGFNGQLFPTDVKAAWMADTALREYDIQLYYDAFDEVERWEWYEWGGVTAGTYAYYMDLYDDAIAMTPDRWEWYSTYSMTSPLYVATVATWPDIVAQEGITDQFSDFGAFTFSGSYEGTEALPSNIWTSFSDLLTSTMKTIAAVVLLVGLVVFMLFKGAPLIIALLVVVAAFIFFVLVAWVPLWWGLILAVFAFLILVIPLLKGGGSSA